MSAEFVVGMVEIGTDPDDPTVVTGGCLGQHSHEVLDDMTPDQMQDLAADLLAAAAWLREGRELRTPCPAWCDGTHPENGGTGSDGHAYRDHVARVGSVSVHLAEQRSGRVGMVDIGWGDRYGAQGLRELAADAIALAEHLEAKR